MRSSIQLIVLGALCCFLTGCKSRQEAKSDAAVPVVVEAVKPPPCVELAEKLCAHFGKGSEMCAFAERQTQRFRSEFCQSKLDKFEESVAELSKYQEARKLIAARSQGSRSVEAPALGPLEAPVVIVMFCDFDAPDCARLSPLHNFVRNLHADKVRLVYRQFPLVKNPNARLLAEASLAAHAQGKFWEYHDVLFSNSHDHSRPALERYAKAVGLKMPEFKKALDDHTYSAEVEADKELGKSLFVSELPAIFANGRSVPTPYGVDELRQLIDDALSERRVKDAAPPEPAR
jgi:protein-disulfide isomerase